MVQTIVRHALSASLDHAWGEAEVWPFLHDMAEALAACHDLEVVHRDLSPANVRCMPDGHFVLMDPGLAKHLEKSALTGSFQPGTPGFRSPEHVPGGEPVPSSDIFALGVLAYYALSHQFPIDPHVAQTDYDHALITQQAPSISSVVPGLSLELARVVDRCLSRQPARRYLDGTELLSELIEMGANR